VSILTEGKPHECSTNKIGVCGCFDCKLLTEDMMRCRISSSVYTFLSCRLGWQSRTKSFALVSFIRSINGGSRRPLPEKPRLIIGIFSFLPKMFVQARPGLLAQAPCIIEVPYKTSAGSLFTGNRENVLLAVTPMFNHLMVLYKGRNNLNSLILTGETSLQKQKKWLGQRYGVYPKIAQASISGLQLMPVKL
jgi:hypothetical protein